MDSLSVQRGELKLRSAEEGGLTEVLCLITGSNHNIL
jgi:hypothetical protein